MAQNEKMDAVTSSQRLDMIFTIVSRGKGENVVDIIRENGIFQNLVCHGHGTAPSSILDMLGLGATEKDVVISLLRHEHSRELLDNISQKMEFAKPGHGISFVVPLQSVAGIMAFKFLTANLSEED